MTIIHNRSLDDIAETGPTLGGNAVTRAFSGGSIGRLIGMLALIAILGFLTIYPLAMLLYGSLHSTPPGLAGEFNLNGYRAIMTTQNFLVLINTVGISLAKTVPSLTIAVFLAWIIARTDTPFRGTLEVLITLPFFIPPILTAMAWGMLGNPQVGVINLVWRSISGTCASIRSRFSSSSPSTPSGPWTRRSRNRAGCAAPRGGRHSARSRCC